MLLVTEDNTAGPANRQPEGAATQQAESVAVIALFWVPTGVSRDAPLQGCPRTAMQKSQLCKAAHPHQPSG